MLETGKKNYNAVNFLIKNIQNWFSLSSTRWTFMFLSKGIESNRVLYAELSIWLMYLAVGLHATLVWDVINKY